MNSEQVKTLLVLLMAILITAFFFLGPQRTSEKPEFRFDPSVNSDLVSINSSLGSFIEGLQNAAPFITIYDDHENWVRRDEEGRSYFEVQFDNGMFKLYLEQLKLLEEVSK